MSTPTKVRLRFPTVGKQRGEVIEVESKAEADRLIANGTASAVKAEAKPKQG
jgi:hypothetical protein